MVAKAVVIINVAYLHLAPWVVNKTRGRQCQARLARQSETSERALNLKTFINGLAFLHHFSSLLFQSAQSALQHLSYSSIHTHLHTVMAEAAMQGANCSSGTIWVTVLRSHAAGGVRDSNQQHSNY